MTLVQDIIKPDHSTSIVFTQNDEVLTSTMIIADETYNQHKSVIQLVRQNIEELELFGQVAFEMRCGYQNSKVEVAHLNERQATLLIAFMRNSDVVKAFKIRLVQQFYVMAEQLKKQPQMSELQMIATIAKEAHKTNIRLDAQQHQLDSVTARLEHLGSKVEDLPPQPDIDVVPSNLIRFSTIYDVCRKYGLSRDTVKVIALKANIQVKLNIMSDGELRRDTIHYDKDEMNGLIRNVLTSSTQLDTKTGNYYTHEWIGRFQMITEEVTPF